MSPTKNIRKRLAFVRSQLARVDRAAEHIGMLWRQDRKRDFSSQGATTAHGVWTPNKPSTIARKGHGRILRGIPSKGFQLMNSIIKRRHPDYVQRYDPVGNTMELGTKHWKAEIHREGKGGLPVRRPVDPTTSDRRKYTKVLLNWILKGKLEA